MKREAGLRRSADVTALKTLGDLCHEWVHVPTPRAP